MGTNIRDDELLLFGEVVKCGWIWEELGRVGMKIQKYNVWNSQKINKVKKIQPSTFIILDVEFSFVCCGMF